MECDTIITLLKCPERCIEWGKKYLLLIARGVHHYLLYVLFFIKNIKVILNSLPPQKNVLFRLY